MTALEQHFAAPGTEHGDASASLPVPPPVPASAEPQHTAPRFANDWIPATLRLGHGTVHVGSGALDWILVPDDFEALERAVGRQGRTEVEWNPDLGRLLVPGGHERTGRSFFTLRPAGVSAP
jgi:hypothetical protein